MNESEPAVKFTISGAKKVCLGEPIFFEAELKNQGGRDIEVDYHDFWTAFSEKAFDRFSNSNVSGIPLKIPEFRAQIREFLYLGGKPTFYSIGKGETHSSFLVLNSKMDPFYRTVGKYEIQTIASFRIASNVNSQGGGISKSIEAEYAFHIVKCE
ncbi:MAG: hypothetical protein R2684_04605 [Pyrinomonadaceae bacterium]